MLRSMIERHYGQRQIAEGFFNEPIEDWWEPWMKKADEILDDEELIDTVYEALRRRHPQSATRGRIGTPAEIVIRLMVLKHVRGWSYETLEREVRANMVYRMFTRIGAEKVPDAKTMGRLGQALGPEVVEEVHRRIIGIALEKKVVRGRKLRVDTTVVETNIHYPTDSSLLGDGVGVLTRTMQRVSSAAKTTGEKIRSRMRSTSRRVMEIARASRSRGKGAEEKRTRSYQRLLTITGQVVRQAERTSQIVAKMKRRSPRVRRMQQELDRMIGLVRGVKRVSIPNRSTKSPERRQLQKSRWFKKGQKWRTGCEGRISVLKRRHGLDRCRYRGDDGMDRWVGFGVIADNLINIGRVMVTQAAH